MPIKSLPALTIKQPWASLIMTGFKNIENRSWTTDYRGEIFIHAGMKWDGDPIPEAAFEEIAPFAHRLTEDLLPKGAILGTIDLVDVVRDHTSPWAINDQWHWVLRNPRPLDRPMPWRGQMGLWYPTRFTA